MSFSLAMKRRRKGRWGRCPNGHPYCTDCQTRRGRNHGNRTARHRIKIALHRLIE